MVVVGHAPARKGISANRTGVRRDVTPMTRNAIESCSAMGSTE
jgi:hypothetical protein